MRRNSITQIDRARAAQFGLNVNSIANNLNISLSSSEQVSPNFWTDPKNGMPYYLAVQTPEYRIASLNDLNNTPVVSTAADRQCRCRTCSAMSRRCSGDCDPDRSPTTPTSSRSTTSMPACRTAISAASPATSTRSWPSLGPQLTPGNTSSCRGQIDSMNVGVSRSRARPAVRRGVRLSADGGELSELRRSVRGHPGAAGDVLRHRHDALSSPARP